MKYRHECTYEDCVKEFGEYPIEQYIKNKSMIWAITNIGNELAEANRLKRLELKILRTTKMGQVALNADIFDEEKELVDQA